jgi:hypothetical protein
MILYEDALFLTCKYACHFGAHTKFPERSLVNTNAFLTLWSPSLSCHISFLMPPFLILILVFCPLRVLCHSFIYSVPTLHSMRGTALPGSHHSREPEARPSVDEPPVTEELNINTDLALRLSGVSGDLTRPGEGTPSSTSAKGQTPSPCS